MASTLTGRNVEERELYTNGVKLSRPATAALAVTTRSASFCRPDIAERTLPILTEEFQDPDRQADSDLLGEIPANRDGLLTWCAQTAAILLVDRRNAPPALPLRFVDFARLVWAYMNRLGVPTAAAHMLLALRKAQALTVGEADPLVEAIVRSFHSIAHDGVWEGRPADLAKELLDAGAELPYLGGGKRIARMLREARKTLELMGYNLSERRSGNGALFVLENRGECGESGEFHQSSMGGIVPPICNGVLMGDSQLTHHSPSSSTRGIPMMITRAMHQRLVEAGYSDAEIAGMTPTEAWEYIREIDESESDDPWAMASKAV
jgi:hypothetical protein